jgi:hypothetical protein
MQPASILPELASGRETVRRSRMVEGKTRNRLSRDVPKHCIDIFENLGCGNSQRFDPVDRSH